MPLSDEQLEELEAYADGELHAEQEDALRRRLESDAALVAALDALRSEREVRSAVWRSCEPSEAACQRLVMKVQAAVDRHNIWVHRLAKWRIPSAAAACILVGFLVGWMGRGTKATNIGSGGETVVVNDPVNGVIPAPSAPLIAPNPSLTTVVAKPTGPVELPLVDEYGRQVGVQRFNSAEEAARFIEDLNSWQRTQEKVKSGNVTLTGSEKF